MGFRRAQHRVLPRSPLAIPQPAELNRAGFTDGRLPASVRRPICRSAASPQSRVPNKHHGGKTEGREITATIALKVAATMPLEDMPVDRERYSTPPWPCEMPAPA